MAQREEMETSIGRQVSKLLRDHFGRGPQLTYVQLKPPYITIYMRDFLAPIERTLREKKGTYGIEELRKEMMRELQATICTILETDTGHPLKEIYYDWNLKKEETATGMIWGVLNIEEENEDVFPWPCRINKAELEKKIRNLSKQVKKAPDEIEMYWLGKNELLVEQMGFLVQIEQELIKHGHEEILKTRKQKLDKEVFTKKIWQDLLQRKTKDVFVDWCFQEDKEYILICLDKES